MPSVYLRRTSQALIALLLFAQLAIAAYACPVVFAPSPSESGHLMMPMPETHAVPADPNSHEMMSGCEETGSGNPNLCASHCQFGDQGTDRGNSPLLPPLALMSLYTVGLPQAVPAPAARKTAAEVTPAAAPPPLAILHCCFRI